MFGINNNDTNAAAPQPGLPAMPDPQTPPMATMPDPLASTPTAPPIPQVPVAEDPVANVPQPDISLLPPMDTPKIELKGAPVNNSSAPSAPVPSPSSPSDNGHKDELMNLKKQALQSLAPLVGHLDQTPEEKFKTTMMMMQASDNSDLVKEAFEAANKITDDKARAQALLDVVNEINYFTQNNAASPKPPATNPS